jgi:hypothetical protein
VGEVHIEKICRVLRVEKRRVYDIVNVMEALEAMQRGSNKSHYRWRGLAHLPQLMFELKATADREQLPAVVARVERAMYSFADGVPAADALPLSAVDDDPVDGSSTKHNNSLSHLCRRFLMVLLSSSSEVSAPVASVCTRTCRNTIGVFRSMWPAQFSSRMSRVNWATSRRQEVSKARARAHT